MYQDVPRVTAVALPTGIWTDLSQHDKSGITVGFWATSKSQMLRALLTQPWMRSAPRGTR
jgi:hypothetical protein